MCLYVCACVVLCACARVTLDVCMCARTHAACAKIIKNLPTGMWNMQMYGMTHEWMTSCDTIMNVLVLSDLCTPSKSLDFEGGHT